MDRDAVAPAPEFAALYLRYRGGVFGKLYALTGNPDLAEDLTQDVFLRAWVAWPGYHDDGAPVGAWLSRIAGNLHTDWCRRQAWRRAHFVEEPTPNEDGEQAPREPIAPDNPAGLVLAREAVAEAHALLARLTPQRRAVLLLSAAGASEAEISARLGLTRSAVKSSRIQARVQCRAWAGREDA